MAKKVAKNAKTRKETATARAKQASERSPEEQIARLDKRLGKGTGAKKERAKLTKKEKVVAEPVMQKMELVDSKPTDAPAKKAVAKAKKSVKTAKVSSKQVTRKAVASKSPAKKTKKV